MPRKMLKTEAFVKAITSIQVALAIFNNGFIYAYWQPSIYYSNMTKKNNVLLI
jgi:hypothetical protein